MKLDLRLQAGHFTTVKPLPIRIWSGSALPLEIAGIPGRFGGKNITGVNISVTNADGVTVIAAAEKKDGEWCALFAASNFANYGTVVSGLRVIANTPLQSVTVCIADLVIAQSDSSAQPGDPTSSYQRKGDDEYFKTAVIDGVQHYTKQQMSYDPEIGWGAEWVGDYILVNGQFVPANGEVGA